MKAPLNAFGPTHEFREGSPRVLVHLAEEVLAVDRVEGAPEERRRRDPKLGLDAFLLIDQPKHGVLRREIPEINKDLLEPTCRSGTRHRELVLIEVEIGTVVQIDRDLIGHEGTNQGELEQRFVNFLETGGRRETPR